MDAEILNPEATLAVAFAEAAASQGWSAAALDRFCAERGLSREGLWPQGVRGVARALNEAADQQMLRVWRNAPAASLEEIIERRFKDNQPLKPSVAALAKNDALHPSTPCAGQRSPPSACWPARPGRADEGWRHGAWLSPTAPLSWCGSAIGRPTRG